MALLDNGTQINTTMPGFIESHSLDVRPLSDLVGRWVIFTGLGNTFTWPIGYVIIWVQVDGVQSYGEDKIALTVLDLSNFVAQVPVILGTPTIDCIMNVIWEEIDALVTPWVNTHVAYHLAVQWVIALLEDDKATTRVLDSTEYNEVVTTKGSEMIDTFSSRIIHVQTMTTFTGVRLNVMTHAVCAEEGPLPQGLMILVMILVARVLAANWVPEPQMQPGTIDALNKAQGIQTQKLTTEQRQEKLFKKLDLSGLVSWLPELADSTWSLLAEYHDIFSLEPCELGCTHSTKHVVKVTDDTPFKEQFRQIPLPLVEEFHAHLWEMLDSGAIFPRVCGVTLWYWVKRNTGAYTSA